MEKKTRKRGALNHDPQPAFPESEGACGAAADVCDHCRGNDNIDDETIISNVRCNRCGKFLPPLTAWEFLNLGKDHPVFQCPHVEGSPSMPYTIRCNTCGRHLPFWLVFAADYPPCHPIHACPHDWDDDDEEYPHD